MANPVPNPVRIAVYATVEDKAFYVAGGNINGVASNQLAVLDLTIPEWNITSPPWTILSPLPATIVHTFQQGSLIHSQSTLFIVGGGKLGASFDVKTGVWSPVVTSLPATYDGGQQGLLAVTDPAMDVMVVPGGYRDSTPAAVPLQTVVYDTKANLATLAAGPAEDAGSGVPVRIRSYAAAWSSVRGTTLMYGGRGQSASQVGTNVYMQNANLLEFSTATKTWKLVKASGDLPGPLVKSCLVPAYKGTKMVLFGGLGPSMASGSIYFLDTSTLTWTKGQEIDSAFRKYDHACTTAGDNFIAWGGGDGSVQSAAISPPVVYDMLNGRWTNHFVLKTTVSPPNPSESLTPDNPNNGGSDPDTPVPPTSSPNIGAIVGGVAGGVVLLLIVGFLIYRRRRRQPSFSRRDSQELAFTTKRPDSSHEEANVPYVAPPKLNPEQVVSLSNLNSHEGPRAPQLYPATHQQQSFPGTHRLIENASPLPLTTATAVTSPYYEYPSSPAPSNSLSATLSASFSTPSQNSARSSTVIQSPHALSRPLFHPSSAAGLKGAGGATKMELTEEEVEQQLRQGLLNSAARSEMTDEDVEKQLQQGQQELEQLQWAQVVQRQKLEELALMRVQRQQSL